MDLAETDVRSPRLIEAIGYWRGQIPNGRHVPPRQRIDPMAVPRLLPNFVISKVHRDPLRFEIRLAGTTIREIYGAELTGVTIAPGDDAALSRDAYPRLKRAVDTAEPVFARNAVYWQGRDYVRYEVGHLPLGEDEWIEKILTIVERV